MSSGADQQRAARAAAIEARLGQSAAGGGTSQGTDSVKRQKDEKEHLLKLRRIVDLQIRRDSNYQKAADCLKLLNTLLHNILDHPEEVKYRSFKAENARISRDVLAVPGGQDFLVQAGFGRRTVAFKAEWYVAPPGSLSDWGWRKLELASKVLQDRVGESEWRADMERDRKSREEDEEKNRVKRALLEAEEDRQRVADRVQRERRVRAAEAAAALSSSASNSTETPQSATDIEHDGPSVSSETLTATATGSAIGPDDYTREVPFDEPSVRPGEAEDAEEDEDGERPPPYGQAEWGTGRRLGSSS